jgi:thiol:disulfide interchange protein DsbD
MPSVSSAAAPLVIAGGPTGPPESLSLFLWLAISMGLLSLLTPCVFPMVPITVSYFSNRAGEGRLAAVRGAGLYAIGIITAFTGLGLVTTMVFGVTGLNRLAADPWLNLAITVLFVVFAVGLFGWVNVGLPSALIARLDDTSRRAGSHASTLLMGLTFALTSFTCTAPFVGTLLVSASQGNWRWPTVGLLAFSATFALPFIALALVPSMLSRLPRSGEWMVTLKTSMAFLELAAAAKFLSNADLVWGWQIVSRDVVLAVWIGIGVLLALYLAGAFRFDRSLRRADAGWGRRVAAVVVMLVVARLVFGLGGRRLGELDAFLPPVRGAGGEGTANGELPWITNDYASGLAAARSNGKPMLIDFTGYTCTNCRWMEANMFPRPAVRDELSRFVRIRLFTDGRGEPYVSQQALERTTFNTVALPLYAVIDSSGAPRATFLGMTRDQTEFVRFLAGARR